MSPELRGQRRSPQFADLLRQHRIASALSQEALAERAGISARAVSDLERGVKQRPHLETVRMLADALGLTGTERATLAVASRPASTPSGAAVSRSASRIGPVRNLPFAATEMVGRSDAAKAAASLILDERVRLLTLTGPGGVGKTRLALAVAGELSETFPDGVTWIELAPISDPHLVPGTILRVLSESHSHNGSAVEALRDLLQNRRMLLVLDNCEHLREAAAQLVADLLPHCHELLVLATSRASLRLTSEHLFPVEPLAVPETEDGQTVESVGQSDAVKLFVLRAKAVVPDFALTTDNAHDVAAICRRLDGLPLAIELAAARVRVLSPAALLGQLDMRFRILTGGAADLPTRHQTLHAALDWSYHLLDLRLQAKFRALSAFAGGFNLEAARVVAGEDDPLATLEDLEQLVDQSLVVVVPDGSDDLRFTMLETVVEYGREQLSLSADERLVRERHAAWFMQLAERAEAELSGPHQATWLRLLDADRDNLREALAWFHHNERQAELLRLGAAMWPYWARRGADDEVRGWLDRAIDPDSGDLSTLAKSYHRLGNLAIDLSDYPRARQMFESSLSVAESLQDQVAIANALNGLGVVASDSGDLDGARTLHRRALQIRQSERDQVGEARSHYNLGLVEASLGNNVEARRHHLNALEIEEKRGDTAGIAYSYWAIASIDIREGNVSKARELLGASLGVFTETGDDYGRSFVLTELGALAHREGDDQAACAHLLEALEIRASLTDHVGMVTTLEQIATAALGLGQARLAVTLVGASATFRSAKGFGRAPLEERQVSQLRAKCLDILGPDDLAREYAHGNAMSLDQAHAAARIALDANGRW
jgi:predicted ATPase/transcriptional regulator with XRE-family HTH domain